MSVTLRQAQGRPSDRDAVVSALREGPAATVGELARRCHLPVARCGAAVRALRYAGKIRFEMLALSPSMSEEREGSSGLGKDGRGESGSAAESAPPRTSASCGEDAAPQTGSAREDDGPRDLLGQAPSGEALLEALRIWAVGHGLSLSRAVTLAGLAASSLSNLRLAKNPKPDTVDRVRALLALAAPPETPLPAPARMPPAGAPPSRSVPAAATDVSGRSLAAEIEAWRTHYRISKHRAALLCGFTGTAGLTHLARAERPRRETVERIRQALAARPIVAAIPEPQRAIAAERGAQQLAHAAERTIMAPARPTISEAAAREAEAAAHRRALARRNGGVVGEAQPLPPMPAPAALQAALIDTPPDAMRAVARAWPELWRRLVEESRARGKLPGAYFFDVVRRGLDELAQAPALGEAA
jgi:hypothetical protein